MKIFGYVAAVLILASCGESREGWDRDGYYGGYDRHHHHDDHHDHDDKHEGDHHEGHGDGGHHGGGHHGGHGGH